jgi:DNA replication protein DnaC
MPGRNAMVLAYGQTGTGKTHSMFGPQQDLLANNDDEFGIFPTVVKRTIEAM